MDESLQGSDVNETTFTKAGVSIKEWLNLASKVEPRLKVNRPYGNVPNVFIGAFFIAKGGKYEN